MISRTAQYHPQTSGLQILAPISPDPAAFDEPHTDGVAPVEV
jgi:hypothetical protein